MIKTERKTQIVQTAAKLFREKGYKAVSMRDLAEGLGIKAASLYNHISSKEQILSSIIMDVVREFTTHMNQTYPKACSVRQKLEDIVQMHVEITILRTDALACMNNDWIHLDADNRHEYIDLRDDYEDKFRTIILQGMKTGEIEKCDPDIIVFSLLSTLRTLYLWYAKNKRFDIDTLKEDITQILLLGIVDKPQLKRLSRQ